MIFGTGLTRLSDADLVALVAKGNEKAFGEVLSRHQDGVYQFARRMLKDPQEAEDAAQETFLRFFKAAGRYRPEASLRTFLLKIIKNICIDIFRKKKPELLENLPDTPDPDTPQNLLEGALAMEFLEQALEDLPINQRTAILLRHTEQMSYSRICEVMDLSLGAVESLLVRARKTLRRTLAENQ